MTQAAASLHLSRTRCYELIKSGALEAIREGGALRVTAEALSRFRRGVSRRWSTGDRLLSPQQVAERLGVSRQTVLRLVRRSELPAIRLSPGLLRVSEDALHEYLSGRRSA